VIVLGVGGHLTVVISSLLQCLNIDILGVTTSDRYLQEEDVLEMSIIGHTRRLGLGL